MIITWTYDDVDQTAGYGSIWTYSCTEPDFVQYPAVYVAVPISQQVQSAAVGSPVHRVQIPQHVIRVER
jgi:hypothetical protein